MSKRTFIFCDECNKQGIRTDYKGFSHSRRVCDTWSWYEGEEKGASIIGWKTTNEGLNICPRCQGIETNDQVVHQHDYSVRQVIDLEKKVCVM